MRKQLHAAESRAKFLKRFDGKVTKEEAKAVLADKGYDYQFSFVRNAWHCDPAMKAQLLPQALEWLWRGYQGG